MAKKQKKVYDDDIEEREDEIDDEPDDDEIDDDDFDDEDEDDDEDDEDIPDDELIDEESLEELGEEDIEENEEEMEQIESKLASGEEFVASQSEMVTLLKANLVYTCPRCRRIFLKNKWVKDSITDVYTVRTELAYCDKCLGKTAENFIGSIEIYDKKLSEKKTPLLSLAKKVEAGLENREPFETIIEVFEKDEILYIFTNTTRLAVEIAKAIRLEWHGAMQIEWFERNQYLRAKWFSEVQNREHFKSRIRAAKEKRIGLFSFEDE